MERGVPSHIGEIIERVRETRQLSREYLAKRCDRDISTIRHLEVGDTQSPKPKRKLVRDIADALQDPKIPRPLTAAQRDLLVRLNEAHDHREDRQAAYSTVDFHIFRSRSRPKAVGDWVDWLANQDRPAMIVDPLMMICAINGAVPLLFGMSPTSSPLTELLARWDMWQVIGGRIRPDSPVRMKQRNQDFMAMNVAYFFQMSEAGQYLFTAQMSALLDRLYALAKMHNSPFADWWERALALDLPFELNAMPRPMEFQDGKQTVELWTEVVERGRREVEVIPGYPVKFLLLAWEPLDDAANHVFEKIRQERDSHRVLFAADYDDSGTLHVNHWPEVRRRLGGGY